MTYRFGVFEFETESGSLRRNGQTVALERQPALALSRLLSGAGEVVTRDELRDAVWGSDTHVDFDRGLAYCLSQIRRALGDSGENPRFVQTLPRKGYRMIAPVQGVQGAPAVEALPVVQMARPGRGVNRWIVAATCLLIAGLGVGWRAYVAGTQQRAVIAVSIFDNESGLPEHDRLVAGLTDLVVARLAEIAPDRLAVIGNAAVLRRPRNIRNLEAIRSGVKADYVALGQLQKAETGLRFVTHLIRLDDNTHLKANRISLPDGSVAGLERAVVTEFERAVRVHVRGNGP